MAAKALLVLALLLLAASRTVVAFHLKEDMENLPRALTLLLFLLPFTDQVMATPTQGLPPEMGLVGLLLLLEEGMDGVVIPLGHLHVS